MSPIPRLFFSSLWMSVCFLGCTGILLYYSGARDKAVWVFYPSMFFCLYFCFYVVKYAFNLSVVRRDVDIEFANGESAETYFIVPSAVIYTLFTAASYSGWVLFGESFVTGGNDSYMSWLAYGLDNYIRAVMFDFAEVYRFDLSTIEHASGFWPSTFVFIVRTSLSISVLSIAITTFKRINRRRSN
tara:strand:+ start:559 stop:1116 length:558 start_codon:yes stop_codon:yes gene_type:complete